MKKFLLLNSKVIELINEYMPPEQNIEILTNFYSCFSDKTRIKIILLLSISSLCVNDICTVLDMNQTTISHQLKYLKDCKIINSERDGKIIKYFLAFPEIKELLNLGVTFIIKENILY